MTKNLVIVESPAKAKTIKKYLGKDFTVLASYGHVRDLIPKNGAVDVAHKFAMKYEPLAKNHAHVAAIAKALKNADALYLATDPDREGEAISWHLCALLKEQKALKKQPIYRIVFHEITKEAIKHAVENPRKISIDLVDAQQARRALDYLVGFNLSPLLWKKIRYGLSAGRVQSPALRMIVEREIEIENFKPQEYWSIVAELTHKKQIFTAKLIQYQNKKLTQFAITTEKQAKTVKQKLVTLAQGKLTVVNVEKKQRKRNPPPPFITSTLQQEAARKLNLSARKTMRIAQQLYEGIDAGDGPVGLITYMRTDSTNLAQEALREIRQLIQDKFGKENLPETPRVYQTSSKNAQEAHEAIRPTSCFLLPEKAAQFLNAEQLKLYTLIWKRTIASQMIAATFDTVTIDFACGDKANLFRATGSTLIDPGFLAVYQEDVDDPQKSDETLLPPLAVDELIKLIDIKNNQHFTEPPPRYSEASLIKTLEEYGIGRPSTYAAIIDTILVRQYVILENRRFKPTDVGRVVNKFLTNYFTQYVDYSFTAKLEDQLDEISRGENKMVPLLEEFWKPFKKLLDSTEKTVTRADVTQEITKEKCPECGKPLAIRLGKNGSFIGCTGFPECSYTKNINQEDTPPPEILSDRVCPKCGKPLQIKVGRYGKFIGCSNYPTCKHMEPLEKPVDTNVQCPECKQNNLFKRKSRRGTYFYSCGNYPKCKYIIGYSPIAEPCPKCHWPIMMLKTTKKYGKEKVCTRKECGWKKAMNNE